MGAGLGALVRFWVGGRVGLGVVVRLWVKDTVAGVEVVEGTLGKLGKPLVGELSAGWFWKKVNWAPFCWLESWLLKTTGLGEVVGRGVAAGAVSTNSAKR